MKWSEEELKWFRNDKEFDSDPWWEEELLNAEESKKLDFQNLGFKRFKNRTEVLPEPFFWEVLRRHPEIPRLRKRFGDLILRSESNSRKKKLLREWKERWGGEGSRAVAIILRHGGKSWVTLTELSKEVGVARMQFEKGLIEFCASERNFPTEKKYHYTNPVEQPLTKVPNISPWLEEAAGMKATEILSVEELRKKEEKKGRQLVVLSVDKRSPRHMIKKAVWSTVSAKLDGLSGSAILRAAADGKLSELLETKRGASRNSLRLSTAKYLHLSELNSNKLNYVKRDNIRKMFAVFSLT